MAEGKKRRARRRFTDEFKAEVVISERVSGAGMPSAIAGGGPSEGGTHHS